MSANGDPGNVRNLRPVEQAPTRVLRIIAGLHAGASRSLAEQEMLVVGGGEDCDIVLADTGVAAHHALITLVGGSFTLRALDAPVRIEGKPLHPGDPVEVRPLQRIDLGEAAIAFGNDDGANWDTLFPTAASPYSRAHRARPWLRRLPLIAAGAVLALALVAVVAAFLPRKTAQIDVRAYLQALIPQYEIAQAQVSVDSNGVPMLSGTVANDQISSQIQQQVQDAGIQASLALRTGETLARDVREVFRMSGMDVQTRYVGGSQVEISTVSAQIDHKMFQRVLQSRAMTEVGAKVVPAKNLASTADAESGDEGSSGPNTSAQPPVDIVSVVRGRRPYVIDSNGVQYPIGETIPGHGRLITIGAQIWVQGSAGEIKQIRPVSAAELAARAGADFGNVNAGTATTQAVKISQPAINNPQAKMPGASSTKQE